jgi:hypothetical protein
MFETIAILFIFFILLVLGLIFYANVQGQEQQKKSREFRELRAIENMQKLMFLPEIQCGKQGIEIYTCADALKLDALEQQIQENPVYYADLFGNTQIVVREVYPGTKSWLITNRTETGIKSFIPISIWYPVEDRFSLGLLEIMTA